MKRHLPSVLLVVACLLPFIRLGLGEILPWDESLYAVRADACLKFGAWLDQTQYAVGGLYSAWHPPLGVWLIAISKYTFGNSTFSTRFPIAIAGSASIVVLWLLVKRLASQDAALIASISLATADLFLTFSHRAQLETLILFFSLASLYSLVISVDRERWGICVVSGILLGLGLLSKIGYALYVVPIAVLMPWVLEKPRAIRFVCVMLLIGLCVPLPWFLTMEFRHPGFGRYVIDYLQIFHTGSYGPSSAAWWYYLNRLVVALPCIVMCFFIRSTNRVTIASLLWLIATGCALQFMQTRMPHFAFLLLAPGAMLIASSWDRMMELQPKHRGVAFVMMFFALAWSSSEQARLFATHRIVWSEVRLPFIGILVMLIAVAWSIYLWRSIQEQTNYALAFSTILLAIALAYLFSERESESIDGAAAIVAAISSSSSKNNLIVIHQDFPNAEYAEYSPQLAYYTHGWTLGWIPGKTSKTFSWDSAITNGYVPDSAKEFAVVSRFEDRFYHPPASEIALWDSLTGKLRKNFSHEQVYRSYVLYY